jgi:hypothetical protein
MAAHHVAELHSHVSAAAHGEARKVALYDGIEHMIAGSLSTGLAHAAKVAADLGVNTGHAHAIAMAALDDVAVTHDEFLKPEVKAGFVALDLGH